MWNLEKSEANWKEVVKSTVEVECKDLWRQIDSKIIKLGYCLLTYAAICKIALNMLILRETDSYV